jgi:hypothetical protein
MACRFPDVASSLIDDSGMLWERKPLLIYLTPIAGKEREKKRNN